jgi:hypothetical protein
VTAHGQFADIGFSGQLLVLVLLFWLGILAAAAAIPAAIAIAIVGPRRPGAIIVPAAATLLVLGAIFFVARWTMADALRLVLTAMATAFAAALIQILVLARVRPDVVIPGPVWAIGGAVAGIGMGAIVGVVAWVVTSLASLIVLFALMGAIVGAVRGAVRGRARADPESSRAAPGP